MIGILEYLATHAPGRQVHLDHTDRSPGTRPLANRLAALATRLPALGLRWRYRDHIDDLAPGKFDLDASAFPGDAEFLLCGPTTFLHTVRGTLLEHGIPSERIRTEQFGPTDWRDNTA
ncbi:hypothetical protein [Nocardia rhamnosiphila]|uniref:hypothetical protein n=1 Tax=Nocardia rhamnosiphila TaxID=426716 RepID=UPI000A482FB0|nr:hypothetical protein [Nocardia rhamnosiphila]